MRASVNVSDPSQGQIPGVWWLLRWVLVVLLVFDQVGSPLHQHQHDAGMDAQSLGPAWHAAEESHAEESHPGVRFAHSVMGVRPAGVAFRDIISGSLERIGPVSWPSATHWHVPDDGVRAVPGRSTSPPHMAERSLPPASRAPPFHA